MDLLLKYKKPLLIIAGILVIVEVIWGVYTLTRPVATVPQNAALTTEPTAVPESSSGSVFLKGPSQVKVGEPFKIDIEFNTTSLTDGADLIIKFDPNILELVPNGASAATAGNIYQDYPANSVQGGVITLSGVTSGSGFLGSGVFGTLNFIGKTPGTAMVSLDFTKGSTTDSNITESSTGRDILEVVQSLEVKITN